MKLHLSHGDSVTANISRRKGLYPGLAMQPCSLLSGRLDPYQKSGSFDRYATDKGSKLLSDTGGVPHAAPWGGGGVTGSHGAHPIASHVCRPQIVPSRKIHCHKTACHRKTWTNVTMRRQTGTSSLPFLYNDMLHNASETRKCRGHVQLPFTTPTHTY